MKDEGKTSPAAIDSAFILLPSSFRYYQLTHDYLVHSLRDWLTRKQKETRKGRAELRLFDRSVTWNAKPENRHLPSWWEYLNIRLFTDKKNWTEPQRKMMAKAGRVHGIRRVLWLCSGRGGVCRNQCSPCRSRTTLPDPSSGSGKGKRHSCRRTGRIAAEVPTSLRCQLIVADLKAYRQWADPLLRARKRQRGDEIPAETPCQPGPVAGGCHAGRLPLRSVA